MTSGQKMDWVYSDKKTTYPGACPASIHKYSGINCYGKSWQRKPLWKIPIRETTGSSLAPSECSIVQSQNAL